MSASGPPRRNRRLLAASGALVSVAAIAAVVVWALHQDAPRLPTSARELSELGAAVALYLASCAVRGERWMALLRHNGAAPTRADAYGLVAVGYLGNNVLPARAGDALRVLFLTPRAHTEARTVIGTVVAERLLDVLVLVGLFVILAHGALAGVDVPSAGRFALAAGLVGGLLVLGGVAAYVLHRRRALRGVVNFVAPMAEATRRLRGRHGAQVLGWTLLVWGLEWVAWWLTAQAAGLDLSAIETGYVLGVSSIFVLVPSGPGHAGTLDAGIIFGVRAAGGSGAAALSYLLLLRFVIIVPITLAGLAILVARFGGLGRLRGAARAPGEARAAGGL